jgi:hypothetical protein
VTRRLTLLVLVAVLATAGTGALLVARARGAVVGGRGVGTHRPGRSRTPGNRGPCAVGRGGLERGEPAGGRVASGILRASPDQVTEALVEAFGGPATEAVPVIVLNGNGVPGTGEAVAERIIPGGFRVAVSQNASDVDAKTLIVLGSPDDVALAERMRDLVGVGSVSVSVWIGYGSRDDRRREGLLRVTTSERRRAG